MQRLVALCCVCVVGCVTVPAPVPESPVVQVTLLQHVSSQELATTQGWSFDDVVRKTLPKKVFQTEATRTSSQRVSLDDRVTCSSIESRSLEDLGTPIGLAEEDGCSYYTFAANTGRGMETVACPNQGCSNPSKYDIHWSRACVEVTRCCVEPRRVDKR